MINDNFPTFGLSADDLRRESQALCKKRASEAATRIQLAETNEPDLHVVVSSVFKELRTHRALATCCATVDFRTLNLGFTQINSGLLNITVSLLRDLGFGVFRSGHVAEATSLVISWGDT